MKTRLKGYVVVALLAAAACGKNSDAGITNVGGTGTAQFQVINASATPINLFVDGQAAIQGIGARSVSSAVTITAGTRAVEFRSAAGATLAQLSVAAQDGKVVTLASMPNANSGISADVVGDTGATVAAGYG